VGHTQRTLWTVEYLHFSVQCVMRSCCAGAELQILMTRVLEVEPAVLFRERYPSRSDLYERARLLEAHYRDEAVGRETEGALATPLAGSVD
jgi:hypothetical protein